jgi:hypothetical protein
MKYRVVEKWHEMPPYKCQVRIFGVWVTVRSFVFQYKAISWFKHKHKEI